MMIDNKLTEKSSSGGYTPKQRTAATGADIHGSSAGIARIPHTAAAGTDSLTAEAEKEKRQEARFIKKETMS